MCVCVRACVRACVCVCLKYLCRSGSDWPENFNMDAVWLKGVQPQICLDYKDTVEINDLINDIRFPPALSTIATPPEFVHPKANHCRAHPHAPPPVFRISNHTLTHTTHTHLRCVRNTSRNKLLWVEIMQNTGMREIREDNKLESESVDVPLDVHV